MQYWRGLPLWLLPGSSGAQAEPVDAGRAWHMPVAEGHGVQEEGRWQNRPWGPDAGSVGLQQPRSKQHLPEAPEVRLEV